MLIKIKVNSVTVENKGKYKAATVEYVELDKNEPGKKMLVSFGNGKDVFLIFAASSAGEVYEVELQKGDKYWDWIAAKKIDATIQSAVKATPKSTYETPEERAARQIYIIRQSSLERAIQYFELVGNKKVTDKDVIFLATTFASWVVSPQEVIEDPMDAIKNMEDDIPF